MFVNELDSILVRSDIFGDNFINESLGDILFGGYFQG